ncbi:hypothetical protein [Geovibrio ferrireducens]|uniref:hypothetical protein n=1 Tax=Geovibrio ferrireducens TaxID=46201 RepID=UPI002245EE19|nr:hypothetical protein [Geovibrio ferrireducens]
MRGEQTTEDTRRRYYFTGYDYLNKYNSEIIEPQMKIKEYLIEQRPEYFNGAFITITITRNISSRILINNLGKLIRYTNELLFSSSIRKTGKGMNGIGSVEKQVNGNMHFHLLLERREWERSVLAQILVIILRKGDNERRTNNRRYKKEILFYRLRLFE